MSAVTGPINIASGEAIAVRDIAVALGSLIGRPDLVMLGSLEDRLDEPSRIVATVHRLRSEMGFRPSHSLEAGLRSATRYWVDQNRMSER